MHKQEAVREEALPGEVHRAGDSEYEGLGPPQHRPPLAHLRGYNFLNADDGWIFIVMEFCDKGNIYAIQGQRDHGIFDFD